MSVRNPGRFMAPVALVAVLVAVVLIVKGRINSHPAAPPRRVTHQLPLLSREVPKKTFYVVKPGDSLSVISVRTHVPVARLEALNPKLANPDTLQTGQRLRLR